MITMHKSWLIIVMVVLMLGTFGIGYMSGHTEGRVYQCATHCPGRVAKLINNKCNCITYSIPTSRSPRWLTEE